MMRSFSIIGLLFFISCQSNSQKKEQNLTIISIQEFQNNLNKEFTDKTTSPLTDEDFKTFKALEFFPIDLKYLIEADFELNQFPVPFEMPTTTDRKPMYQKYGTLYFTIDGKKLQLSVYQNIDLSRKKEYEHYLFVPFTDFTSGKESYGGGRYIDLEGPLNGKTSLDFNKAYNPYCAYNHKYSCPIPPKENFLKTSIKAGVKKFH